MPLVGLTNSLGENINWENVSVEHDWGYYQPFVMSIAAQALEREKYISQFPDPKISVSTFVKPLRQVILDERYEYYEVPDKLIDMWAGVVLHAELARHNGDDVGLSTIVEGITLCGRPDHIKPLYDFKDTKIYTVKVCEDNVKANQPEYYLQLQVYNYLLQVNGHETDGGIALLLRAKDYSDTEKARSKSPYPEQRVTRIPIEPSPSIGDFIVTRMKRYLSLKEMPDAELPMCEDSERWPNSAMKSFINSNSNKATGRMFTRCRFYCPVADKCSKALGIPHDKLSGVAEAKPAGFDYINAYNVCVGKFGKEALEELYHVRGYKGHPPIRKVWVDIYNVLKKGTNHES